ncbi:sigma-54-dependent Fis family transcriptional regulator [bacterium]|nr:sigma-54-dependent Fis family transcriptional regulator [bacterium]
MISVVLVEDDVNSRAAIVDTLELDGLHVIAFGDGESALAWLSDNHCDMVISDVNLGEGIDGHQLMNRIQKVNPLVPIVLMTAYGTIARSIDAIRAGAVDYVVKPFDPKTLIDIVREHAQGSNHHEGPVAVAASSCQLLAMAQRVAQADSTVLISGESGTGKEVLARFIHANSPRADKPFVAINCAAIPEAMLESSLFGYEKGAFTGAVQSTPGKFELANGGTLLLDEISEMDISLQAKLLRVLQEREVERLGGRKAIALDVRVVATTNRDLRQYVAEQQFREDLFYRLNVFPLRWLALRDRREDIVPLSERLIARHCTRMGRRRAVLSEAAKQALSEYPWPGNVRELDNLVQRALILQPAELLEATDFLFDEDALLQLQPNASLAMMKPIIDDNPVGSTRAGALGESVKQREQQLIMSVLEETGGQKKLAAEKLGISPRTLRHKLQKMREEGALTGG